VGGRAKERNNKEVTHKRALNKYKIKLDEKKKIQQLRSEREDTSKEEKIIFHPPSLLQMDVVKC
jgi:hypothetical protein